MTTLNKLHLAITILLALGFITMAFLVHRMVKTDMLLMQSVINVQGLVISVAENQASLSEAVFPTE